MASRREQPLPADVIGRKDAIDVLRAFAIDGGLSSAFAHAFETPDIWGLLRVDIARHAACARARAREFCEDEASARILDMINAEIARPTDMGATSLRPGH